jgi:DnaD/phage-associated family protein
MADHDSTPIRKPLSVRTRFEVFKRDEFTCRYCGRTTPDVVLEVDHVVPVVEGGSNDPMNLVTACWDCNSGKSAVPLNEIITGEDPHDRAILLLEKQRQLREYDRVLADLLAHRTAVAQDLVNWWCEETGNKSVPRNQFQWLVNQLQHAPVTLIQEAMQLALSRDMTKDWRYAIVVLRNWREDGRYSSR